MLVIASLPRSKCLLIPWLQSPPAVILEPKKINSLTVSIVFPSTCHELIKLDAMIFAFWMFSFQFSSFSQSFLTLCDPVNLSTPGLSVHHQLLEFTQTHVHWVCDDIQPSHPPWYPSPPALNLSQHQDLFQWVSCSHQVSKSIGVSASTAVLLMNTQD